MSVISETSSPSRYHAPTSKRNRRWTGQIWGFALSAILLPLHAALSEDHAVQSNLLPPAKPVAGALVIAGGGVLPATVIDKFFELAGNDKARIVIITTASQLAGTPEAEQRYAHWLERQPASMTFLHTRDRLEADRPEFSQALLDATAVWFMGGNQNWLAEAYLSTVVEERCHALLRRGGVIGGTSAGAAIMSRAMIAGGRELPVMASGFGFLEGTIIDQHFRKRNRQARLMQALELRPGLVGIGIDEGTALIVRGRTLEVIGDSDVTVALAAAPGREARVQALAVGKKDDLVKLSRAAIARTRPAFPSQIVPTPEVKAGTLVIVGGGPTPREAVDHFLCAAGGKDASIVVVSNALGDEPPEEQKVCGWLTSAGASNVHQVHARSTDDLANPEFQSRLKTAKGVWFTGGRQWRLVDAYLDTPIQCMFQAVLNRGGVIGGTSAGATIQGEYLVRGNPLGNEDMMTEGYERGFGFLPGVAIDQHFTQRSRFGDMTGLKKAFPQLIGLGVDEATALIVRGTTMEVVGKSQVAVFDRQPNASSTEPEYEVVKAGQKYDFKQRRLMDTTDAQSVETK
jgi:cyanophycinase